MGKFVQIPEFALQSLGLAFGLIGLLNRQLYARAIEPLGINDQQLFILAALANLGPQVEAHLSQPLNIDKATMVGLINELETKGLVQRQVHPTDRRAVLVALTEEGRQMLLRGFEISDQYTAKFFKGLSSDEQELLQKILRQLAANTQELVAEYDHDQ
jgi:DNA-binding MarR family transcriptional regulator